MMRWPNSWFSLMMISSEASISLVTTKPLSSGAMVMAIWLSSLKKSDQLLSSVGRMWMRCNNSRTASRRPADSVQNKIRFFLLSAAPEMVVSMNAFRSVIGSSAWALMLMSPMSRVANCSLPARSGAFSPYHWMRGYWLIAENNSSGLINRCLGATSGRRMSWLRSS